MTLNEFKNKVQNMSEQDFKTFSNLIIPLAELSENLQ